MRPTRVTLVQFREDGADPAHNLAAMKDIVREHKDSDLIVFPELALAGHAISGEAASKQMRIVRAVTREDTEAFDKFVREIGARVVFGELREHYGRLYNAATYTNGTTRASYFKTHVHWSESFQSGSEFPVLDTPLGPTGMLICFDAAFPEVPRILATKGAKAIVNISAIPSHFPLKYVHRRLVGTAIHNQVAVLFANRTGDGFEGGSCVVDSRGEIVAMADEKQDALTVDVDMADVDAWRHEEPLLPNRRPLLYKALSEL